MERVKLAKHGQKLTEYIEKDIVRGEDGFYIYWPTLGGGAYTAHCLRLIADVLDERNAPWQKELEDYFNDQYGQGSEQILVPSLQPFEDNEEGYGDVEHDTAGDAEP